MKLELPIFKPLFWVSRRAFWVCRFWGRGILINRLLMEREWLPFDRAVQIQSWLIARIHAEQAHSCRVHLKILQACFAAGEIPSLPSTLDYFEELRALYEEGRYETMLIQLYQLNQSNNLDSAQDDTSTQLNEM